MVSITDIKHQLDHDKVRELLFGTNMLVFDDCVETTMKRTKATSRENRALSLCLRNGASINRTYRRPTELFAEVIKCRK